MSESPNCAYWTDCGVTGGGCCRLGRFGGKPSFGVCQRCDKRRMGLGDWVAFALRFLGIGRIAKRCIETVTGKPCGCHKRRNALNQLSSPL